MNLNYPNIEKRLQKRYQRLVKEHIRVGDPLASGLRALPDTVSSFASTQAAWRFYQNEKTDLSTLMQPLLTEAHCAVDNQCNKYALSVSDWSAIGMKKHKSKTDLRQRTHNNDVGYELQTSLLLDDNNGTPIAPIVQNLLTKLSTLSTYDDESDNQLSHLDELTQRMNWIAKQNFSKPIVHIIDREAASIFHQRQWNEDGNLFLVRERSASRVNFDNKTMKFGEISANLDFTATFEVSIKGQRATQYVAETMVVITRPAKPKKCVNGKRVAPINGKPLSSRLVISRIVDSNGKILAEWLLLTNVHDVDAKTIALWYYWRWRIESFFKLLKQSGHQLESWQQETGLAIAKRLLIASMACVVVWQLGNSNLPEAKEIQELLVKLSGRQVKRSQPVTYSAVLSGLWVFLSLLQMIEEKSPEEITEIKHILREMSSAFAGVVPV